MFHHDFKPRGVCSRAIHIDLDDAGEVVEVLAGNTCGPRKTSRADQLTLGLREAQEALRAGAGA